MILIIDNYNSFVFNVARYLVELGEEVRVVRNDDIDAAAVRSLLPKAIVLSPGPCTPNETGVSLEIVKELSGAIPILGICLGHQCIGQAFGARSSARSIPCMVERLTSCMMDAPCLRVSPRHFVSGAITRLLSSSIPGSACPST